MIKIKRGVLFQEWESKKGKCWRCPGLLLFFWCVFKWTQEPAAISHANIKLHNTYRITSNESYSFWGRGKDEVYTHAIFLKSNTSYVLNPSTLESMTMQVCGTAKHFIHFFFYSTLYQITVTELSDRNRVYLFGSVLWVDNLQAIYNKCCRAYWPWKWGIIESIGLLKCGSKSGILFIEHVVERCAKSQTQVLHLLISCNFGRWWRLI